MMYLIICLMFFILFDLDMLMRVVLEMMSMNLYVLSVYYD